MNIDVGRAIYVCISLGTHLTNIFCIEFASQLTKYNRNRKIMKFGFRDGWIQIKDLLMISTGHQATYL